MDNEERTDSPTTPIPPECVEVCVHFGYPHGTRAIREGASEEATPEVSDTTYGEGDVIALFHKVSFVNTDGDFITTELRIVAEEYGQVAEFAHECKECKTVNWVSIGLPASEYRCVQCVAWLT
jgi:hypothetical protein